MSKLIDIIGNRFGRLIVTGKASANKHGHTMWFVRCDCNPAKEIPPVSGQSLKSGNTTSCGCMMRELSSQTLERIRRDPKIKERFVETKKLEGQRRRRPAGETGFKRLANRMKQNAKKRGLEFMLDDVTIRRLTKMNCAYCGSPPKQSASLGVKRSARPDYEAHSRYEYNGVDRIDSAIGYIETNCVPCCWNCNTAKLDMPISQFCDWIRCVHGRISEIKAKIETVQSCCPQSFLES